MIRCAFNVFSFDSMEALNQAVASTEIPVFMQVSVSTAKYLGPKEIFHFYERLDQNDRIQLHLDHCNNLNFIKECIDAGWTSIMADFSGLPIEKNVQNLNLVRSYFPAGLGALEAEVGAIGGDEDGFESSGASMAKIEDVSKIFSDAEVDFLAIGIGNIHGHYTDNSRVDFEHFKKIGVLFPGRNLVLHGATGLPFNKVKELKSFGLAKINISTALKDVYLSSLRSVLEGDDKYNMTNYSRQTKWDMETFFKHTMTEFSV